MKKMYISDFLILKLHHRDFCLTYWEIFKKWEIFKIDHILVHFNTRSGRIWLTNYMSPLFLNTQHFNMNIYLACSLTTISINWHSGLPVLLKATQQRPKYAKCFLYYIIVQIDYWIISLILSYCHKLDCCCSLVASLSMLSFSNIDKIWFTLKGTSQKQIFNTIFTFPSVFLLKTMYLKITGLIFYENKHKICA